MAVVAQEAPPTVSQLDTPASFSPKPTAEVAPDRPGMVGIPSRPASLTPGTDLEADCEGRAV